MDVRFELHPAQWEIYNHPARYKVVVAGRRFGKSFYAVATSLIEGSKMQNEYGYNLDIRPIYYIAPTYAQAKKDTWALFRKLGGPLIKKMYEKDQRIKLFNDREIWLFGADRPETIRGQGLHYVVLDEYKDMRPEVWDEVVSPMLTDVRGKALFIGTPKGKNHFYHLMMEQRCDPEWGIFLYHSSQNPHLARAEIESARRRMSTMAFKQEYEASFATGGGQLFKEEWFEEQENQPTGGSYYIAVDPAGFKEASKQQSKVAKGDETAIAVAYVSQDGWWVPEIAHGRWGVRECSLRILRMYQKYRPIALGIEDGIAKNALLPYLMDQGRRLGVHPNVQCLRHGGQKKQDRIMYSLQGRLEHGRLKFKPGSYLDHLKDQALDFPSPMTHDDLLDALSYIDQLATTVYIDESEFEQEYWTADETGVLF